MNDRNLARNILLEIEKLRVGESILIDELLQKYPNVDSNEVYQ